MNSIHESKAKFLKPPQEHEENLKIIFEACDLLVKRARYPGTFSFIAFSVSRG